MAWREKLRSGWRAHKYSFLISFLLTLLAVGLYLYTYVAEAQTPLAQFVDSIELKSYDARFRMRGQTQPSPQIVIVGIDQSTLQRLGSWPFSRQHFATLIDRLSADGAKVIGFDVNFPKPDEKSALRAIQRIKAEYAERVARGQADRAYLATLEARERDADTDQKLADAISRAGNVVLGYYFYPSQRESGYIDRKAQEEADNNLAFSSYSTQPALDAQGATPPSLEEIFTRSTLGVEGYLAESNLLLFTEAANFNVGYFNYFADRDGIFRHALFAMMYRSAWRGVEAVEANFYPPLDIQVLRLYLEVPEHETALVYNRAGIEAVRLGALTIPTDPDGRMLIHYQGGPFTYPHISLVDVVEGTVKPGLFRDKIVLVGPTALGINDFHPTPFAESFHAGVELHANVLDTVLNQRFIHRGDREKMIDLALILAFGLGVGALLATVRPSSTVPVALLVLVAFLAATYVALSQLQVWLNVVVPAALLTTNTIAVTSFRVLLEEREKRKTRAAFQQYLSPGLIQELLKNPEQLTLGGVERELTIMFSDIRGFTSLSEKLSPLELTTFLNAYTDEMTDIIFQHWGTLDKFEGDAIMCFWGAPYEQDDHVLRACAAALAMSQRMDELRRKWREEGKPDINIGLGLNTGQVVVGNMGSRKRFNYTVLGDPVNLASRLEGVNKEYATRIIVSEFTHRQAANALAILERRVCRQYRISPEALTAPDGSPAADRARQVALYLSLTRRLAPAAWLAERYGGEGEATATRVEQWKARDKKLSQFLAEAQLVLHPFVFRQLDWIRVKGKSEPVAIYELLSYGEEGNRYTEMVELFDTGLKAYRGQQWDAAIEIFESIVERSPDDGPARLFAARCRRYKAQPPDPNWDGVYVMTTK